MPEPTVAAPPASPSAPVAPASVAPTVAAPPAPPSTPAVPAAPVTAAPAAPPVQPKYDPQTAPAPPKSTDYSPDEEGQAQFMADNSKWGFAHPDEAVKIRADKIAAEDGETPAPSAPEASVAEQVKAVEGEPAKKDEAQPAAPIAAATPAAIEEWTTKSPKLAEAFKENPELQTAVMEMARFNESAKPVMDIVSTKEEALFAVDYANRLVNVQSAWMMAAEDPDMVQPAWGQIEDMFKSRDANGAEIKDAQGAVQFDADFAPFLSTATATQLKRFGAPIDAQIAALEQRLAGNYPNEEARAADTDLLKQAEYEKMAYDFVLAKLNAGETTQLPSLPPNATKEQIDFQKKLEERQKELDAKQGKQTVAQRKEARRALDVDVDRSWSKTITDRISAKVNAMKERGEYIPDFVLEDKWINPQTGQPGKVSAFGMKLYQQLNQMIYGNPVHRAKLAQLQAAGASAKDARIAELNTLTGRYLPKLIDAEVTRIQTDIRKGQKQPAATVSGQPPIARQEPNSVGSVQPQVMGKEQVRTWAEGEAKKDPTWNSLDSTEREALIISIGMKKRFGG
jgi:hypothetical protein